MRIRKSAARLLGSAPPYSFSYSPPEYDWTAKFEPDPPPPPTPMQLYPESYAARSLLAAEPGSGEPCCELSRSPWDLLAEVSLNDPQEEDRLVETYLVQVARRAGWFVPSAETVDEPRLADEFARKKKRSSKKTTVVKEEEEENDEKEVKPRKKKAQVWTCKKNDGKLWHCRRPVSSPDSLCEYHQKKRAAAASSSAVSADSENLSTAAASKTSRTKKKGSEFAGEGFYYYTGFAPSSSKRHRRPSIIVKQESSPVQQEEKSSPPPEVCEVTKQEDQAASPDVREDPHASPEREDKAAPAAAADQVHALRAASRDDEPGCEVDIAGIAGVDEESSDDYTNIRVSNSSINGDGMRKMSPFKKRYRKPVKVRSLKSLM